jgi:hypothetical protein
MAARQEPKNGRAWTPEKVRQRIRVALLLKRLEDHVLDGSEMSKTQVAAATVLLKKTLPDLQSIEATHRGDALNPIMITATDSRL